MSVERRVVIVGGGASGFQTAEGLRGRGFEGTITMIDPEDGLPYDRPPLSKQFLVGTWGEERVRLRSQEVFDALRIEHLVGVSAERLDVAGRQVVLSDGAALDYDDVVIATGASPVLPQAWRVSPRVMTLRTFCDSSLLGEHLRAGRRVCVIGAGMIGSEIASSARSMGLDVTLVDASSVPLQDLLGAECADRVMQAHRDNGVHLLTGVGVESLSAGAADAPVDVRLVSGETITADVVVVAIGVRPNTQWLDEGVLSIADGVLCDEGCRAADGVFAAGDVAKVHHSFFGESMRFEQRVITTEHARVVADRVMGTESVFEAVPYYWSDQHHVRLQGCGLVAKHAERVEVVAWGDATVALFLVGDQVRGGAVYGAPKVFPRLLMAVKGGLSLDDAREKIGQPVVTKAPGAV